MIRTHYEIKKLISIVLLCFIFFFQSISTGCIDDKSDDSQISPFQKSSERNHCLTYPLWMDGEYHDYQRTARFLKNLESDYPHQVEVFSIGKSVMEKDIWCIKITNEKNTTEKDSCVIDGCIHGNEWESGEICLYLAEFLLLNFNLNQSITHILNTSVIYLIPLLNPDGRDNDFRYNDNGVDLNRNFDVHFGRLRSRNYPLGKLFGIIKIPYIVLPFRNTWLTNCGKRPFSESESSALRDLMDSIDPDSLSFYVNCHTAVHVFTSVSEIDYKPEFIVTDDEKKVLNRAMSWVEEHTQYESHPVGGFSFTGAGFSHHWVFKQYRIPSFLFELLSQDFEPGFRGGGPHDDLVYWMKESLPVLLYLLYNIQYFNKWEEPERDLPFLSS